MDSAKAPYASYLFLSLLFSAHALH
jgi:hypothetical protein